MYLPMCINLYLTNPTPSVESRPRNLQMSPLRRKPDENLNCLNPVSLILKQKSENNNKTVY